MSIHLSTTLPDLALIDLPEPAGSAAVQVAVAGNQPALALIGGVVRTARPRQWLKNVLVLAAPAAAGVLTRPTSLGRALVAMALFCAMSSGTYFLNDALDVESDRAHPTKRLRPIAAGVMGVRPAIAIGVVLMAAALAGGSLLWWKLGVVLALYVAVQFSYSLYLKHQPVYDLVAVSSGFVLRAVAGAVAVGVPISGWFLIVATFGSLLMVTGKRLGEIGELGDKRGVHRLSLEAYTASFLRCVLALAAAGAIIGYGLWALSLPAQRGHHHSMFWCQISIVPMFIALLKYAYLVEGGAGSKPEELVLADRSLQLLGVLWLAAFAAGVYAV